MAQATTTPAAAAAAPPAQDDAPTRPQIKTWPLLGPSVVVLLLWMIVPLVMTLWFSFQRYNLLNPFTRGFAELDNYAYLLTDPALGIAMLNTLILVGGVLIISVVLGTLLAVLFDQDFPGKNVARLLAIAPFFVMPTVGALIWKNLLMHPVNGVFAFVAGVFGLPAVDWFTTLPLTSIMIIVAWQWTPFALLILLTAIQSLDVDLKAAARLDGAGALGIFRYVILPHLRRPIAVVIMVETIFLLTIFAEIRITTSGGPGLASTNLAYLIFTQALVEYDIGGASAGGVIAIILANIVAFFLVRTVARTLEV